MLTTALIALATPQRQGWQGHLAHSGPNDLDRCYTVIGADGDRHSGYKKRNGSSNQDSMLVKS